MEWIDPGTPQASVCGAESWTVEEGRWRVEDSSQQLPQLCCLQCLEVQKLALDSNPRAALRGTLRGGYRLGDL